MFISNLWYIYGMKLFISILVVAMHCCMKVINVDTTLLHHLSLPHMVLTKLANNGLRRLV